MARKSAGLTVATMAVHALAAIGLLIALAEAGVAAAMCLIVGALIGLGSMGAQPGRPLALYLGFGVVLGYGFWMAVGAIHRHDYLEVIPAVLLAIGAAWMLGEPGWPPAIFMGIVAVLCFAGMGLTYQDRYDIEESDAETIRRSVLFGVIMLVVGLAYLGVGFAGALNRKARKSRSAMRAFRTPTEPPML